MDYMVYIRFEENPAQARRHVLAAEQAGGTAYVLDARYQAVPGEEEPILHEAFDASFGQDKYITLYRGFPVGEDYRGRKLFTPVGMVWSKDRVELGQMLGLEMSYDIQEHFEDTTRNEPHFEAPVRSPWSEGGSKGMDWGRPTQNQEEGRNWQSRWLEDGGTEQTGEMLAIPDEPRNSIRVELDPEGDPSAIKPKRNLFARPTIQEDDEGVVLASGQAARNPGPERAGVDWPHGTGHPAGGQLAQPVSPTKAERDLFDYDDDEEDEPNRSGWWKWLIAFVVCLIGSFVIVYGASRLLIH